MISRDHKFNTRYEFGNGCLQARTNRVLGGVYFTKRLKRSNLFFNTKGSEDAFSGLCATSSIVDSTDWLPGGILCDK